MLAELYIMTGKDAGKFFKLGHEPFIFLGRSFTNQIPLDDREVSRVHCRIEVTPQGCILRDLASGNGTYVNEERANERPLGDGDLIRIGQTILALLLESPAEAEDWKSFAGVGEGSELAVATSASALDMLSESQEKTFIAETESSLRDTQRFQTSAVVIEEEEEPAPFSSEEDQANEAEAPRDKKKGISIRNLVPGYVIERKIGGSRSSTDAVIYKGVQASLERAVAIKALLVRGEGREKAARRFLREVSQVARLPHPNIVVIHDAGRVKNFYFFVMEYLAGGSILDLISDKKPLSLDKALRLAHEIAQALAYIHHHGVLHRGVNPGCILLDSATGMSKLSGFGFAREMEVAASDTTYLATPVEGFSYLAPEQILGRETTPRADIYSLGLTLWTMLTGRVPVRGKNHIEVSAAVLDGRIPSLLELAPQVPKTIAEIVQNCIQVEPEGRYTSADALERALRRARMKLEDTAFMPGFVNDDD